MLLQTFKIKINLLLSWFMLLLCIYSFIIKDIMFCFDEEVANTFSSSNATCGPVGLELNKGA